MCTDPAPSGFDPIVPVPAHCTAWRAAHALAARLPDSYIPNSVGSSIELTTPA